MCGGALSPDMSDPPQVSLRGSSPLPPGSGPPLPGLRSYRVTVSLPFLISSSASPRP